MGCVEHTIACSGLKSTDRSSVWSEMDVERTDSQCSKMTGLVSKDKRQAGHTMSHGGRRQQVRKYGWPYHKIHQC